MPSASTTRSRESTRVKATDLLERHHREVKAMFHALKAHTTIEEEIFYPAVREIGTDKAEAMCAEALEEPHVVDLVLAELPSLDPGEEAGRRADRRAGSAHGRTHAGDRGRPSGGRRRP